MCHDAEVLEEQEDAAVHIINKWHMFSLESLLAENEAECVTKKCATNNTELDSFEAELSALSCADDE